MTDKKRDEADKRNAFWIGLRFEHQGNRIGARGRPASLIGALDDNHKISHQARRMGVDFIGNSWFQNSNLYHRRMMQVHGLPLFVENIDGYEKYPIFSMKTILA